MKEGFFKDALLPTLKELVATALHPQLLQGTTMGSDAQSKLERLPVCLREWVLAGPQFRCENKRCSNAMFHPVVQYIWTDADEVKKREQKKKRKHCFLSYLISFSQSLPFLYCYCSNECLHAVIDRKRSPAPTANEIHSPLCVEDDDNDEDDGFFTSDDD